VTAAQVNRFSPRLSDNSRRAARGRASARRGHARSGKKWWDMALQSAILKGNIPNPRLEQAADGPPAIKAGPPDDDVEAIQRIQQALVSVGHPLPRSFASGRPDGKFRGETKQGVIDFQKRVFSGEPAQWDGRVGKKTLAKLDERLERDGPPIDKGKAIADALAASRASLTFVLDRITRLEQTIDLAKSLAGTARTVTIDALNRVFARDVAVIADKLITRSDPLSAEFSNTLQRARRLVQLNLASNSGIIDEGILGRCSASNFEPPDVPFAATTRADPDPRVSVCTPFFSTGEDMRRDVITHEFFHLVGLADVKSITRTENALNDANTMAQVVAYMHDRMRTTDSSGLAQPAVAYPSP